MKKVAWDVGRNGFVVGGWFEGVRGRERGYAKTCFSAGIHGIAVPYRFIISRTFARGRRACRARIGNDVGRG